MASAAFPPCPPQLKTIQHYLKLASDYQNRNDAIAYWARLYALQASLKIDRKSPEAKALLNALMDWLERFKKENSSNESITHDVAGQALVENEGHKLFTKADTEDRAARFNKNVVKAFYTAGILFDVCEVFGELSEEVAAQRKYAKWKATYIHNCLKKGETPIPGPIGGDEDEGIGQIDEEGPDDHQIPPQSSIGFDLPPALSDNAAFAPSNPETMHPHVPHIPQAAASAVMPSAQINTPPSGSSVNLTAEQYTKVQKYCKFAISSLDYEDSLTATSYLQKALSLLTTGKET